MTRRKYEDFLLNNPVPDRKSRMIRPRIQRGKILKNEYRSTSFFERGEAMLSPTIKDVAVASLLPHPKNREIYGTAVADDFVERVERLGILEPLIVKADGTIISGHRRWLAARKCGFETIPARLAEFEDDLDEIEALIIFNDQREKTVSEIAREGFELQRIEGERAKKRQGARTDLCPNLDTSKQRTDDAVAESLGISRAQWHKLRTIFTRAQQGDAEAAELMKALDAGDISVHKAYKTLKGQVDTLETLKRGHKEHDESMHAELETLRLENSRIAAALEEAKKPQAPVTLPEPKVVEKEVFVTPPEVEDELKRLRKQYEDEQRLESKKAKLEEDLARLRVEGDNERAKNTFLSLLDYVHGTRTATERIKAMAKAGTLTVEHLDESERLFMAMVAAGNDGMNTVREAR